MSTVRSAMRRDVLAGLTASAAALTLAGCLFRPVHSFRFRVTVEVDTPEGLRSGSSVMEMGLSQGMAVGDSSGVSSRLIGEAVAVDLPGGTLFMLLGDLEARGGIQGNVISTFFPGVLGPASVDAAKTLSRRGQHGRKAEMARENYPTFVTFDDRLRPETVREADPDAFQLTYGRYAKIRTISFEITDDDVTKQLDTQLQWITRLRSSLVQIPNGPVKGGLSLGNKITIDYLYIGMVYN